MTTTIKLANMILALVLPLQAEAGDVRVFAAAADGEWSLLAWDDGTTLHLPSAVAYRIDVLPAAGGADRVPPWSELVLRIEDEDRSIELLRAGRKTTVSLAVAGRAGSGRPIGWT